MIWQLKFRTTSTLRCYISTGLNLNLIQGIDGNSKKKIRGCKWPVQNEDLAGTSALLRSRPVQNLDLVSSVTTTSDRMNATHTQSLELHFSKIDKTCRPLIEETWGRFWPCREIGQDLRQLLCLRQSLSGVSVDVHPDLAFEDPRIPRIPGMQTN